MSLRRIVQRRGGALFVALVTLLVVMMITMTLVSALAAAHRQTRMSVAHLQAQWLAEAAISRATAQLALNPDYASETWRTSVDNSDALERSGVVEIKVARLPSDSNRVRISAEAHYTDRPWRSATARREYVLALRPAAQQPTIPENAP